MARKDSGRRSLVADTVRIRRRVGCYLPSSRTKFTLRCGEWEYLVDWWPWNGLHVDAVRPWDARGGPWEWKWERPGKRRMKRLQLAGGADEPDPKANAESKVLKLFPRILAHVTETAYDDGKARKVGYLWIKVSGTSWAVTLFEPDVFGRLECRGHTLDEALSLAEKWLGSENAPWEVDQWQRERAAKNPKKKGA